MENPEWNDAEDVRSDYREWLRATLPDLDAATLESLVTSTAEAFAGSGHHLTGDQLKQLVTEQTNTDDTAHRWSFPPATRDRGLLAMAWRMTVQRQTRAVLTLVDAGLDVEALANARVAVEHAVMLRALGDAEKSVKAEAFVAAVQASSQGHARSLITALGQLDEATGGSWPHLVTAVQDSPVNARPPRATDRDWNGVVAELFGRISNGAGLLTLYKWLSEHVHAGFGSAMPYLSRILVDGHVTPVPVSTPLTETLAALSWACWSADDVLDMYLDEPVLRVAQREALARYGIAES